MTWRQIIKTRYQELYRESQMLRFGLSMEDYLQNPKTNAIDMEMDSIEHVLGCTGDFYDFVVQYCKEHNIDSVIDIGCAYGHQAEAFVQANINYEGVNDWDGPLWKKDQITYHIGKFPFELQTNAQLAISNLCYGYFIHNYEVLAKQYSHVILNNITDLEAIEQYFDVEKIMAYDSETKNNSLDLYILTRNLEKCKMTGLEIEDNIQRQGNETLQMDDDYTYIK